MGDYSEKGGRPSHSALLPLVILSLTSIGRLSRYWTSAAVGDVVPRRPKGVYLAIGPLLSWSLTPLGRLSRYQSFAVVRDVILDVFGTSISLLGL